MVYLVEANSGDEAMRKKKNSHGGSTIDEAHLKTTNQILKVESYESEKRI